MKENGNIIQERREEWRMEQKQDEMQIISAKYYDIELSFSEWR